MYTLSYDNNIEFECILTNVILTKISNYRYHLSKSEGERIDVILKESLEEGNNPTSKEVKPRSPSSSEVISKPHSEPECPRTPKTGLTGGQESARERPGTSPIRKIDEDTVILLEETFGSHNIGPTSDSIKGRLRQLLDSPAKRRPRIKFTVEMEEREKNGHSGLRIDVWETPAHPDEVARPQGTSTPRNGSPVQHSHLRQSKSSAGFSPIKKASPARERKENLSEGEEDLDPNAKMPCYNKNIEEKQPHAEDISMKSINDDEAAPGSNEMDPGPLAKGADQRLNTPGTKKQTEE